MEEVPRTETIVRSPGNEKEVGELPYLQSHLPYHPFLKKDCSKGEYNVSLLEVLQLG